MTEKILQGSDITKENLFGLRHDIAVLREQKGKDFEALDAVRKVRKAATEYGFHEDVVNTYWEECLIGKHLIMQARDEITDDPSREDMSLYGFYLMRTASKEALDYINQFKLDSFKPRAHRFLGQVDIISENYNSAITHFREGIDLFEKMENPRERWNTLEFSGFLAEALILSGKIDEGITLAEETFDKYDEGDGLIMKEVSYYQWAIWKSGCIAKIWNAIFQNNVEVVGDKRAKLLKMLDSSMALLRFPDGSAEQGGLDFGIRKTEFDRIKKRLDLC